MCTLTWWSGEGRYDVFFNRDEKKERPVGDPPALREKNGVSCLAPRDPAAGGTWLLANEFGVTLGVLNWYARDVRPSPDGSFRSRGRLLLDLADGGNPEEVHHRLSAIDLRPCRPFRIVGFFPDREGCEMVQWNSRGDGALERIDSPPMPICSSSFDREKVVAGRESAWNGFSRPGPEDHWRYHHGTDESGNHSAYSVRMNRPDAQTWSISRVSVEPGRIEFLYEAEVLDLAAPPEIFRASLKRRY